MVEHNEKRHTRSAWRRPARLLGVVLATMLLVLASLPVLAQSTEADNDVQESTADSTYTVQRGDSWSTVSRATGVSVRDLKAANPDAVRSTDWLIVGEELVVPATDDREEEEPELYIVQAGESWNSIADALGIDVDDLKAANPLSIRIGDVLYVGERLLIPPSPADDVEATPTPTSAPEEDATEDTEVDAAEATATPDEELTAEVTDEPTEEPTEEPVAEATATPSDQATGEDATAAGQTASEDQIYVVQPGESWNSIAAQFGISAQELRDANPDLIRPGLVLYREDRLVIPSTATVATDETEDDAAAAPSSEEADVEAPAAPDAESDTAESGDDVAEEVAATQPALVLPECPADFADYPDAIIDVLNLAGADATTLEEFLAACEATLADGLSVLDLTGDDIDDLVVLYVNPASETAALETELLLVTGSDEGYDLAYRAGAAGEVRLLATEDINADDQTDVVWVDTNCGASTCFDTVVVYSWDGRRWSNWADGNITMAYTDVVITEASDEGQGREIVLDGGVYGSVGAGPQRSRIETWASLDGEPYTLLDTVYAESNCIYHVVLDANRAFDLAPDQGFDPAEELYTSAVSDDGLVACWVRDNEVEELQSFSYFRLALIAAYQGLPDVASDLIGSIAAIFPTSPYAEVGDVWLTVYEEDGDIAAACDAVLDYLEDAPEAWQILADYGYANPTFSAEEVCPVLDIAPATDDQGARAPDRSRPAAGQDGAAADAAGADEATAETAAADAAGADGATAETAAAPALAACPETVDRFASVLPTVLAEAAGDTDAIDSWLRTCGALDDRRGDFLVVDLNGDGMDDAVFMPTIVSDLGYGPGGSQGAVLILHAAEDGSYDLVYEPDVYGQPALLAAEDLNDDQRPDIAWSVESCSTFCVLEVQMITWNGSEYVPGIEPGATIAEGEVEFVELGSGATGQGKAILLSGGVSGVPEGGLAVPHTENWQSVDGAPYARLEWVYDREAPGSDCVGLRLVEADVAMQAADVLGYDDAIGLYTNALDNQLEACSLFGIPPTEELVLLQGLASFRLIQAQALNGDADAAQATLLALQSGQPDGDYTEAAATWLDSYVATGNAESACDAVADIFARNDELWRITDQFGFNHPALAAEQICVRP